MRLNQRRWLSRPSARRAARSENSSIPSSPRSIWLEDIARSPDRLEIAREAWIAFDLAPQPRDLDVDSAQVVAQLRRECGKQGLLGAGQTYRLFASHQLAAP